MKKILVAAYIAATIAIVASAASALDRHDAEVRKPMRDCQAAGITYADCRYIVAKGEWR